MKTLKNVLITMLAVVPVAALADKPPMKPGMYEYSVKMEMPGMPFAMPAINTKRCLTEADLNQNKHLDSQNKDDECQVKNLKQSAGKASFDLACKDGTTGHADYTFNDSGMAGKTVMSQDGQPGMTMNMTAKHAGACP